MESEERRAGEDEGRPPLGSWRAFHALVLGILAALILGYSAISWTFK